MGRTASILLISGVVFFALQSSAQQAGYDMFAHYTSENGLPQNSINSIKQDKKGFVWLGTSSGLVRFDGHSFRTFNLVNYNPKASNRINDIITYQGRLFAEENRLDVLFEIVDENTIRAIKRDSIIVVHKMTIGYKKNEQLSDYKAKHNIGYFLDYITDSSGSTGYTENTNKAHEVIYYKYPEDPVGLGIFSWREMDHSFVIGKRLYIIDRFTRLLCFEDGKQVAAGGNLTNLISTAGIPVMKETRFLQNDGNLYMATPSKLYRVTEQAPGIVNFEFLLSLTGHQEQRAILYLPDQQVLMIGTGNEGLFLFRKRHFSALQVPDKLPDIFDRSPFLSRPINIFYPVAELNDSTVLTSWGGLTLGRSIIHSDKVLFPERNIPLPSPGLFIGFRPGSNEPVLTDKQLQIIGPFDPERKPEQFGVVAREKDTVYIRLRIRGKWSVMKYLYQAPHNFTLLQEYSVPDVSTYCMVKPAGDTLYMGTEKGLYAVSVSEKNVQLVKGLEQNVVRALYNDRSGKLWIGTYGKGWYLLDNGRSVKLYMDQNKNLENVHAFLEDDKGFLWVSTNNGLFRFLKTDLQKTNGPDEQVYYNYFTREYGFLSNEFNGGSSPAALRMSNGKFVFPGMNGLVVFDPLQVPTEQPSAQILTAEYTLDGNPVESLEGLQLSPGFSNFSLGVFVPYFGQSYNLQLEYRLSSGTESWTRLPDNGLISFNRLTHGDYVLSIRMLKGFGSGEYITKEIRFTVAPKWYQTNLFKILIVALLGLSTVMYVRWRTRKINQQKELLEKEVMVRTEALKASEEKVRQNAQFKSQVTSLVLHDVRSPLYYLNKITGNIYQRTEGKVPDHVREQLKDLHLSVKEISAYAQTLFAWISAQQDDFIIKPVKVNIVAMLEEIAANYQLMAAQNNNKLTITADPQLEVITQADLLQIVVRNLVDNAIKFTNNGSIRLQAIKLEDGIRIIVSDTGKGMVADRVDRILGKDNDAVTDTRSGMGYRLIRDLLKKLGGRLEVESELGKGTMVAIILPAI